MLFFRRYIRVKDIYYRKNTLHCTVFWRKKNKIAAAFTLCIFEKQYCTVDIKTVKFAIFEEDTVEQTTYRIYIYILYMQHQPGNLFNNLNFKKDFPRTIRGTSTGIYNV